MHKTLLGSARRDKVGSVDAGGEVRREVDLQQYFPVLMDKTTLAGLLGINPKTLDRRAASGTGPARIKIGQKVWFRRQAVIEWLLENERRPPRAA